MSAKEMFEELGFKCQLDEDNYINWLHTYDNYTREIAFDFNTKCIEFYCYINKDFKHSGTMFLTTKELQAINKQAEELGWLGSDKE